MGLLFNSCCILSLLRNTLIHVSYYLLISNFVCVHEMPFVPLVAADINNNSCSCKILGLFFWLKLPLEKKSTHFPGHRAPNAITNQPRILTHEVHSGVTWLKLRDGKGGEVVLREAAIASKQVAHPLFYQWQIPEVWHSIARARCTCSTGNAPVMTSHQVKPNQNKIDRCIGFNAMYPTK